MMSTVEELTREVDSLQAKLTQQTIGEAFRSSKFVAERLTLPADIIASHFGQHFTIDGGRIVGLDANGTQIWSRARIGEIADFDEALSVLVGRYEHRDAIMTAPPQQGSGVASPVVPPDGKPPGAPVMKRAAFDAMSAGDRGKFALSGGKVVD
jgi:hypothetical protein